MKQLMMLLAFSGLAQLSVAQTDSTQQQSDTITVGNFAIVKKNKPEKTDNENNKNEKVKINIGFKNSNREKKLSNVSTNWFIFDLGFANLIDNTNYTAAQSMGYLKTGRPADGPVTQNSMALNSGKSSNANLWFFMQKINVTKHVLNLKYGLGLEMYNFRYDRSLSYRNTPMPYVFNDSIGFSKNKLYVGYLTVPFMININPYPTKKHAFSMSFGVSAGYLVGSHNKQISAERGKQKYYGDMMLQPWRFAAIGEIGLGPVRLYGSYSLNDLHKEATGLKQTPYAVGIRFSNW
ncbi:MAG: hypothetical protein JSR09_04085 [Bacteroidetes bacterium]|nr:hypothetical protein [Bacteroidota bacterium]MBS1648865.1 hypothetical protein [Bacteroidota bacterium]